MKISRWLGLVFLASPVVFFFQNCANSNLTEQDKARLGLVGERSDNPAANLPIEQNPPAVVIHENLPLGNLIRELTSEENQIYGLAMNSRYSMRFYPGYNQAVLSEKHSSLPGKTFCLTNLEKEELLSVMQGASLCEGQKPSNDEMVCAQIYEPPYATLYIDTTSAGVVLGERFSSCQSGPDLCGDRASHLRNLLSNLIRNLVNHECSTN